MFSPGFNPSTIKSFFVFLQNFKTPHPHFFSEAWSLSVEEWFYLLIPLLLFIFSGLLRIRLKQTILAIAILIILFSAVIRYYRFIHVDAYSTAIWDSLFRKQVITRLDSIMFGVIGAYVAFYYKLFFVKYKIHFFITGLVILIIEKIPVPFNLMDVKLYMCVFSLMKTSIGTLFLLPFLAEVKHGKGFLYKTITYVSLTSYSMYLINYSLIREGIIKKLPGYGSQTTGMMVLENLLYYGLVIILSILIYKYFEKPIMDLRERIRMPHRNPKPIKY